MQTALIIGASGGIGGAIATSLDARGTHVTRLSRSVDGFDITDETTVEAGLGALDGPYDLILVATGVLKTGEADPEKSLKWVDATALARQYATNAIGPLLVLKHAARLLPRRAPSVFAALSARVGSIGDNRLGGWYGYRAAKAGLNQLIHTASVELARTHPQLACVCLHPGTVETAFTEGYRDTHPTVPAEEAAGNLLSVIDGLGPEDTGRFFDYAGREIPW